MICLKSFVMVYWAFSKANHLRLAGSPEALAAWAAALLMTGASGARPRLRRARQEAVQLMGEGHPLPRRLQKQLEQLQRFPGKAAGSARDMELVNTGVGTGWDGKEKRWSRR